jgi:hypothetical protein
MRPFVPTSIRWFAALALSCFALPGDAQQSPASRTTGINFTEPKSSSTFTNQSDPKDKPFDLLGLDSPIRKPYSPFGDSPDSFSGVSAPPPRRYTPPSATETKRLKEALDRKKNWAFATPEEMFGIAEPDEESGTGLEKETASTALGRYLERQETQRTLMISNRMKDDSLSNIFRTEKEEEEDQQKLTREEKPIFGFLADPNGQIPGGSLKIPGVSGFGESIGNLGIAPTERPEERGFSLSEPARLQSSLVRNAVFEENKKQFMQNLEGPAFTFDSPSLSPNPALNRSPLQSGLGQPQPFSVGNVPAATPGSVGGIAPSLPPTAFGTALPSLTPAQSFVPPPAPAPRVMPAPVFELPMRRF